jgi:hypothetical protein
MVDDSMHANIPNPKTAYAAIAHTLPAVTDLRIKTIVATIAIITPKA